IRATGPSTDQVRAGDQSQDCQSARPRSAADAARPCGRGDRMMRRREVITLIGGAAAWPMAAWAQEPKPPTIGFRASSTAGTASRWTAAFLQGLLELGWIDGRTVVIEYRWAEGRIERFSEIVAEFVRLRVDVIVTSGSAAVTAAKQATSTIP